MFKAAHYRPFIWHIMALLAVLVILLAEFAFMSHAPLLVDEPYNLRQVLRFTSGDFSMEPQMNLIPGYHALVALILAAAGKTGAFSARLVSAAISAGTVILFYLLTRKVHGSPSIVRTLQFAFLPLFFPYFSLIYTDVLALFLVLAAFYLALDRRYTLAGLIGILSILARTNNIAWLAFLYAFVYHDLYGLDIRRFLPSLLRTWIYWLGFVLFMTFLIYSGGIAIGNKTTQPLFKFETGNLAFLLFVFVLLFLPLTAAALPRMVRQVAARPWILPLVLLICCGLFLVYHNTHEFNNVGPEYFLRNGLLMRMVADFPLRAAYFAAAAFSLLSLAAMPLAQVRFYWLYPFTVLSLIPFWLVEPRYYFVPLSLFLLFRTQRRGWAEWLQVAYGVAFSFVLLHYIRNMVIFI